MASVSGSRGLNFSGSFDVEEILRNQQKVIKGFGDLRAAAEQSVNNGGTSANFKASQLDFQNTLKASRVELERLKLEEQALLVEQAKLGTNTASLTNKITANKLAQQELTKAARLARTASQEVAGSYAEAQKRLTELGKSIRGAEGGFKKQTPEIRTQIKEYNQLNDALKKFDAQLGNHQRNVGNYQGAIKGAASDLLGFATTYLSLGNALSFVFDKTLAFQRIKTPLTFILGSEGEANNRLGELKRLADELGVSYFTLANTYRSFTAAARASNFDLAQSEKIFTSVTKASAVLGLSSEQLEGALLAVQQMISKGNVQSEELRGQLGERLPGAFSLAAKAMGVTEAELGKLLQTGQVVASDLLPKLATELDKAYGDKAADGIKGLNAELGRLTTALESSAGESSALSAKVFEPIVAGAREAVKEIGQLFRGSFSENLRYLFTFSNESLKAQRQVYDLRDAYKNNLNAQRSAEEYKTEGKSLGDLRTKYDQLTQTMRSAVAAQALFKREVNTGKIKETTDASVVSYTANANAIIAQRARIGNAIQEAKKQQVKANKEVTDEQLKSISEIRKRIAALQKETGSAVLGSDVDNRIKALQERLKELNKGGGSGESEARKAESALKAQRALQAEIDALTKRGVDKQKSEDEQEISAVAAKYKKLIEKAVEFNRKKSNIERGLKVNTSGLVEAQTSEEDFIRDKQSAKRLKDTLDVQKALYSDFEQYKSRIGEKAASERFANEIGNAKTYYDYLKNLEDELINGDTKAKGGSAGNGERNAEQLKVVQEALKEAGITRKKIDDEVYANAVQAAMGYVDTIKAIDAEFERNKKALGDNITAEQLKQLEYNRDQAKKSVNEENAYRLSGLADLFANIDKMTRERANKELDLAKETYDKQYNAGKISAQEYYDKVAELEGAKRKVNNTENNPFQRLSDSIKKYREQLGGSDKDAIITESTQKELFNNIADAAAAAGEIINSVAGALSDLGVGGEKLQDVFKGVAGILDGANSIGKGIASGNPVDIITGSIKLLTSAIGLFNTKDKKLQKQIDNYKAQLDSLSSAYSQLERQASNAVGTSIYDTQAQQIENLKQQQLALTRARDAEASKKKKDQGIIDDYNKQIADIPNKIEDIQKAISESLIQTNFRDFSNALADAFTDAFKSGEDAAGRFDDVFNNVIANAIKNSLKLRILDPIVNKFTTDLANYAKANGNSIIGFDFDAYKTELKQAGDLFTQGLEQSKDFFKEVGTGAKDTASSTGIARTQLTEDTGQRLEGIWRAQYELTKITNSTLISNGNYLASMSRTAIDNFNTTVSIEQNTANTVIELRNAIVELRAINSNTKSPITARGAGI